MTTTAAQTLSPTDCQTCEACWIHPVKYTRTSPTGRILLCPQCAAGEYPARTDLFPPLGIYGLTEPRVGEVGPVRWDANGPVEPYHAGKHRGPGSPQTPPDPGPPMPSPPPQPTPGRPPV